MNALEKTTICVTMGLRPDLLRLSLESLSKDLRSLPTVGINDFGDPETSDIFRQICPHGTLVDLGGQVGHNPAIDAIYEKVSTPYILHLEDDWEFHSSHFLDDAIAVLEGYDRVSQVCLRALSDMKVESPEKIESERIAQRKVKRLDTTHHVWHRYTFNPNLSRKETWESAGKFTQFPSERQVSRYFKGQGMYSAYLEPGFCRHIGNKVSTRKGQVKLTTPDSI